MNNRALRRAPTIALYTLTFACRAPSATTAPASTSDASAPLVATAALATSVDAGPTSGPRFDAGRHEPAEARCEPSSAPPPLREIACVPEGFEIRMRALGLTKDGRHFGHCHSPCDPCGSRCRFVELATGKTTVKNTADEHRGEPDYKATAAEVAANAFLEAQFDEGPVPPTRALRGPFPYDDIVFATETVNDGAAGTTTLRFGAKIMGEAPVFPFSLTLGPHPMSRKTPNFAKGLSPGERAAALADYRAAFSITPAALARVDVSPDGKHFGFVAFSRGTGWYETSDMLVMPTAKLVAQLYKAAGLAAQQAKRHEVAATLFAKAAAVLATASPTPPPSRATTVP